MDRPTKTGQDMTGQVSVQLCSGIGTVGSELSVNKHESKDQSCRVLMVQGCDGVGNIFMGLIARAFLRTVATQEESHKDHTLVK